VPVRVPSTTAAEGATADGEMEIGLVSPRISGGLNDFGRSRPPTPGS
jgi:hypothetical protein